MLSRGKGTIQIADLGDPDFSDTGPYAQASIYEAKKGHMPLVEGNFAYFLGQSLFLWDIESHPRVLPRTWTPRRCSQVPTDTISSRYGNSTLVVEIN